LFSFLGIDPPLGRWPHLARGYPPECTSKRIEQSERRGVSTEQVTVEILAVLEGRAVIDTVMAGWQDAMSGEDSLAWVRARTADH
jgi:hypothetical protein